MDEKNCLFCKHSLFMDKDKLKDREEMYNSSDCDIHGLGLRDRAKNCSDFDEKLEK